MNDTTVILVLAVLIGVPLGIAALVYLLIPACKGMTWLIGHVAKFVISEIGDSLRLVGGILTTLVFMPLTVGNVLIGRWSGASHYGKAIQGEFKAMGAALYRIGIGHPARLLCLSAMTEGIEKRLPEVVAGAPAADKPPRRVGQFEGYNIVGSLPGGGSGGKLYIAEPTQQKLAAFARAGIADVEQVVIKCFSLRDGSSLPQIVRENRALPAAKRLGLILEHELTDERFFYIMKYVPGDSLGIVTQRLHAESGPDGLASKQLREAIEYAADLARTLCHYHDGGLWHKDVKPDNIIVARGQAHLVDFGLITPLRSSMTLTTHGTEYFRDPEMVRMALRGVKVHEVDGAKFDIYAAGAVLYSVIENSFPAHGGLSQISKRCPEALRWIVRRAMTDYDKRYANSAAMLADLEAVARAADPFEVKPAMLPSFRPGEADLPGAGAGVARHEWEAAAPAVGSAAAMPAAFAGSPASLNPQPLAASGGSPKLRVTSWWTGKYEVQPGAAVGAAAQGSSVAPRATAFPRPARVHGATAAEQLSRARERAKAARARAQSRMKSHAAESFKPVNAGVGFAALAFLIAVGVVVFLASGPSARRGLQMTQNLGDGTSRVVRIGMHGIQVERVATEDAVAGAEDADLPVSIDPAIRINRHALPAPQCDGERGQIMVLRDPISFEKSARPLVDAHIQALCESGFELRGNAGDAAKEEDPAETELVAELRNELGVTPFNTPDSREIIQNWLDRYSDINALVWIGRDEHAEPNAWVVGRRGVDEAVVQAASNAFMAVEKPR